MDIGGREHLLWGRHGSNSQQGDGCGQISSGWGIMNPETAAQLAILIFADRLGADLGGGHVRPVFLADDVGELLRPRRSPDPEEST